MKELGYHSAQAVHVQIEAMRHAYVDRNSYLGDPDFVKNPLAHLLDKNYAARIRAVIDPNKAGVSKDIMPDYLHLSEKGYQIWADAIKDSLADLLGEGK